MRKTSSSNFVNPDKSFSSRKSSSFSHSTNSWPPHVQSTDSLKQPTISTSTSFIEPHLFSSTYPSPFDLQPSVHSFFLRSSPYYSNLCTNPTCFHCETLRQIFFTTTTNERYSSMHPSIDYERFHPRMIKLSNSSTARFHPYLKSTNAFHPPNQLPFVYPHLSLSSTSKATRRLNNNPENNN